MRRLDIQNISLTIKDAPARATRLGRLIDRISLRLWLAGNINMLLRVAQSSINQDEIKVVSMRLTSEVRSSTTKKVTQALDTTEIKQDA